MLAPFSSECAGEVDHSAFGCVIRRRGCDLVTHQAVHGCDINDTTVPVRNHRFLGCSTCDTECAEQVNLHLVLKLRVSDVLSRSDSTCAGVVHDDVDTTEMSNRFIDHLIHRFGVRDITLERQHLYPKLGFDSRFHF